MNAPAAPLVVTLRCDGPGWGFCVEKREKHFPAHRNQIPAHLSLFHHLPGEEFETLCSDVRAAGTSAFDFSVNGVRFLGRGLAFTVDAPPLVELHQILSTKWNRWLTPQDRSKYSPHITIQNKAEPAKARELFRAMEANFSPFALKGIGIDIWHYRGGPWQPAAYLPFQPPQ